jgi:hypothetical protein
VLSLQKLANDLCLYACQFQELNQSFFKPFLSLLLDILKLNFMSVVTYIHTLKYVSVCTHVDSQNTDLIYNLMTKDEGMY